MTFAETKRLIVPLVEAELRDQPKPLGELTADLIWKHSEQSRQWRLNLSLVDMLLRQLEQSGEIVIADDGEVSLPMNR